MVCKQENNMINNGLQTGNNMMNNGLQTGKQHDEQWFANRKTT